MAAVKILVAEHDGKIASDIARGLKQRGYDIVATVDTARLAMEAAKRHAPDLVLMDVRLREADDGIEAARDISAANIPIIFLTADAVEMTAADAKEAQGYGYVLKPFDEAEVHAAIELALTKHRAELVSRTAAVESLRLSDDRFRLLVESLPDYAVFMLDPHGAILTFNPAAETMYGQLGPAFVGRPFSTLFPSRANSEQRPDDILEQAKTTGSFHGEDWQRRMDASEFWADIVTTTLRNPENALLGYASIVRDRTERRQAEEAVRQLNLTLEQRILDRTRELAAVSHELEAFTYSVAHDLRAPLRGITGFLEAIRDDFAPQMPRDAMGFLERGIASAGRMRTLIDDLLKLSRVGRQELTLISTPLRRIVDEVIQQLPNDAARPTITWEIGELPVVTCDPVLIRQVFAALISNAVKFTRPQPSPTISIRTELVNDEKAVVVADNGVGFDMQRAGKLFAPFFRMHAGQEFEGTGIGLATTERIIRRHGGRIWAEAHPGRGATFHFTLGNALAAKPA